MDHNSQQPSHMPLSGPSLLCPLMPLVDQHFHTFFKPDKLSTNNQNLINNKEACIALVSPPKPQTTKIIFINKKIRLTPQNHNIPSLQQFHRCIKGTIKLACHLKRLL
jgi:hypothetical protein